ncbi:MAG: phosphoenolpyruvate--protein phosphotransferase [bacterium]|nr:phosphoenolpyruvate--protein phosphotransferase [bacterium]
MKTDHIKMLCDIGDLNSLFEESMSLADFLQMIVEMVADHMNAEVCSIYMYNEQTEELVLQATRGLNPDFINKITMNLGEGLAGTALLNLEPVCERCGEENPNYKYYPGTNEELFQSFLAVPIIRGNARIGVLVVQRPENVFFVEQDIMAMRATANQLASMIENVKLLMPLFSPASGEQGKRTSCMDFSCRTLIKGKAASEGYAYAQAVVAGTGTDGFVGQKDFAVSYTLDDFNRAVAATEDQLEELQKKVEEKLSDAASLIFAAHLLMLKDNGFIGGMRKHIEAGLNPPNAVIGVYEKYRDIFSVSPNLVIREKVHDIEDLANRIIGNIISEETVTHQYEGHILIARELFPSELLKMSAEDIKGIILVSGGVTSHISILARSLEIPLIFTDDPGFLDIPEETTILLDAELGNIYLNPSTEIIATFEERNRARDHLLEQDDVYKQPARTKDGTAVKVMVNVNLLSDINHLKEVEIDGVGLYRTEFPFLIRNDFPSEEEQLVVYTKLVKDMKGKPVTFRTLDIGGDKVLSYYETENEENPFLGMRSIRFSLKHEDIFIQQIRAILRAGKGIDLRIMFPMIFSLDQFIHARDIVFDCMKALKKEQIEYNENPRIGLMVEIPSVITIIDDLAKEAGFLSVGTNDLIQYTLAVDRTNEKVADLYIPHHPAILKSLKAVADAGARHNIDVSVCGDMANDEKYVPFLIGIGRVSLSVDAVYIPRVKKILSRITMEEARETASSMLALSRISEIERVLDRGKEGREKVKGERQENEERIL